MDLQELLRENRELRNARQLLQAVLDNTNAAIYVKDLQGRLIFANHQLAGIYGLAADELLGKTSQEIVASHQEAEAHSNHDRRVLETGQPISVEQVVPMPEGARVFLSLKFPLRDDEGRIYAVGGVSSDITDRKRMEQELKASEQKANDLVRYAPSAIYEIDSRTLRFRNVNDAMCRTVGYSREELLAMDPFDLLEPESRAVFASRIRQSLSGEPVDRFVEYKVRPKDGRSLYAILNTSIIYEDGKPIGAFVIGHDVTQRKEMEEGLRESERRIQEILESISDGFWAVDREWRFAYLNHRAAQNLGFESADLIGKNLWETFPGILGTLHEEYYRKVMEERVPARFEMAGVISPRAYSIGVYPSGVGISVYWLDITERKEMEAEHEGLLKREQEARAEAESAVRVRDQFISVASHELKTPVTTIKGYSELLLQRANQVGLDASSQRMLSAIDAQTGRLEKMISALLDITRIESGQLSLERAPMDLNVLLQGVVDDVRPTLQKHTLEFRHPEGQVVIHGDDSRLEQVIQNLIQNAVKYSPMGGPILLSLEQEGEWARVVVQDKGIGIPSADLPALFTRFHRARNAEKYHISGLGVGLFVVREIVRLHGGDVTVESEEGHGSTFVVVLPLAEVLEPDAME